MQRVLSSLVIAVLFLALPIGAAAKMLPSGSALVAAVGAATTSGSFATSTETPSAPASTVTGDLIALTRPAIVRIITQFTGTTTVPSFDVNLETLTWSVGTGTPQAVPYDTTDTGSGFVVNPDGYIVTNAHVVSTATLRTQIATQLVTEILFAKAFSLSASENAKLTALGYGSAEFQKLTADGIAFVADHLSIPTVPVVTVLKPSTALPATTTPAISLKLESNTTDALKTEIASLVEAGFPATVVASDDTYPEDEKDVALIHIDEKGLPAIHLGDDASVHEGDPVYVFGFPATADNNGLSDEPSFTPGIINALKDSTQHSFQYLQTNATVSSGSSGSPMLDQNGAAVGVLTLLSSNAGTGAFALAVPVSLVKAMLASSTVPANVPGDYASHFTAGLTLESARHCKQAIAEFQAAASASPLFADVSSYVEPHIDACSALIASGQSLDGTWDYVRNWIGQQGQLFWVILGGGLLFIIMLVVGIVLVVGRLRREERRLHELEEARQTAAMLSKGEPAPIVIEPSETVYRPLARAEKPVAAEQPATKSEPTPAVRLIAYIEAARKSGQNDMQIRAALVSAGWETAVVDHVLHV